MSRIADALAKARQEQASCSDKDLGTAPAPRLLADVMVPWELPSELEPSSDDPWRSAIVPTLVRVVPLTTPVATEESGTSFSATPPVTVAKRGGSSLTSPEALRSKPYETARGTGDSGMVPLARQLFLTGPNRNLRRVLFVCVTESERGCDLLLEVAEASAALLAHEVCLVDLQLQRPTFAGKFGLELSKGFSNAVVEGVELRKYAHRLSLGSKVWIATAGSKREEVFQRINEERSKADVKWTLAAFKYVIGYTTMAVAESNRAAFSDLFDGAVVVTPSDATTADEIRQAAGSLTSAGAKLLGTIVDKRLVPAVVE